MSRAPRSGCSPAASRRPSGSASALAPPPPTTALGALLNHVTGGADAETFQPMNCNFGLFPPLETPGIGKPLKGTARKQALAHRALADLDTWLGRGHDRAA